MSHRMSKKSRNSGPRLQQHCALVESLESRMLLTGSPYG